jgi:GTPase SAR1 family protein
MASTDTVVGAMADGDQVPEVTVEASPPASGGDALAEYRRHKLELAELIRAVLSVAAERRDEEKQAAARDLQARLAEDSFQLAVVGQFSRGKSTLMNAILGGSYLPTGALPMTSVVTTVRYGSRPRALVQRAGSSFPIETPLDELVRFVAQASLEREELRVASAEVEVPAEILRHGFSFVDTPGIGSAIVANTATTESFLPEADAVIFVTSFDAPLSEAEVEFLVKVRRHVEKLFLVVNKLDLVSEAEAEGILRYVRERAGADGGSADLRVFATSARHALESRVAGDRGGLADSGLPELERPLVRFLTAEKSRVFLLQVAGRAERLLARQKLDLELGRLAQSEDGSQRELRRAHFDERMEGLIAEEREVAARLHARIEAELPAALHERSGSWPEELGQLLRAELEPRFAESTARTVRPRLEDARAALLDAADDPLEGWLRQHVPQARALLLQLGGAEIGRLQHLRHSVERAGAEAFDLPAADKTDRVGWSPSELPQLAVRPVDFDVPLEVPWWFSIARPARLEDGGRRRLLEALEHGIATYCDDVQRAIAEAANLWVAAFGADVEAETRRSADRLRERLRLPGSDRHLALLEQTEQRLAGFRQKLGTWNPGPALEHAQALEALHSRERARAAIGSCVICERIGRVPFDYLAHEQYELATRENSRTAHAERGGFCALHTWQYAETASDLGIALAYGELAQSAARLLRSAEQSESTEEELRDAALHFVPGRERCPVCLAVAEAERDAVAELLAHLPTAPSDANTPPLCILHAAAVLAADPGDERGRWIVRSLSDALERAAEDMQTYALKRESLRRHLMNDEERAAYLQAIARVAGHRELARPWRIDDEIRYPDGAPEHD